MVENKSFTLNNKIKFKWIKVLNILKHSHRNSILNRIKVTFMSVSILKALTQQEKLQATIKKYKNWAGSLKR